MKRRKKSRVKKNKNNSKNLKIIGIVALTAIIIISIIIFLKDVEDTGIVDKFPPSQCITLDLKISEINPDTNMIKINRGTGKGDLSEIKIVVNGNPINNLLASDIKEGTSKIFIINVNSGDKIEIAPILKDGKLCEFSDTKIA